MAPGQFQKTKRGIFGLDTWDPAPRPPQLQQLSNNGDKRKKLMAKYNYKANPDSPLGTEMDLIQGEFLYLVKDDPSSPLWCIAEKDDRSQKGYVPVQYVQPTDTGGLPWLQNKTESQEEKDNGSNSFGKAPGGIGCKPYVSAYAKNEDTSKASKDLREYYCEVCDKQLNGPQPYRSHMLSKSHKEELEIANWKYNGH